MTMRYIGKKFTKAVEAANWLKAIQPVLHWTDATNEHACSVTFAWNYPLKIDYPPQTVPSALSTLESNLDLKDTVEMAQAIQKRLCNPKLGPGGADVIVRANRKKPNRSDLSFFIGLRGLDPTITIFTEFFSARATTDPVTEYTALCSELGLPAQVAPTLKGIKFIPQGRARVECFDFRGEERPNRIKCTFEQCDLGEVTQKAIDYTKQHGWNIREQEFSRYFEGFKGSTEETIRQKLQLLNDARLQLKAVRCEMYMTLQSALHLQGLLNLKQALPEKENLSMEIAEFILPSGLKGWIGATTAKVGLEIQIYTQSHGDEDDLIPEVRAVLKDHLPK